MKKQFLALAIVVVLMSCGNGSNSGSTPESQTADSTNINNGTQMPAGDTAHQMNDHGTYMPDDSSNKNGNDSVKGTSGASRRTTPGNESGKKGRKE